MGLHQVRRDAKCLKVRRWCSTLSCAVDGSSECSYLLGSKHSVRTNPFYMQHHNTKQVPEQPTQGGQLIPFTLHSWGAVFCSIPLAGKHAPLWLFVAFRFRTTKFLSGKTGLVLVHCCSKDWLQLQPENKVIT